MYNDYLGSLGDNEHDYDDGNRHTNIDYSRMSHQSAFFGTSQRAVRDQMLDMADSFLDDMFCQYGNTNAKDMMQSADQSAALEALLEQVGDMTTSKPPPPPCEQMIDDFDDEEPAPSGRPKPFFFTGSYKNVDKIGKLEDMLAKGPSKTDDETDVIIDVPATREDDDIGAWQ